MIAWGSPNWLQLLPLVPIVLLALLILLWRRRKAVHRLAEPSLVPRIAPDASLRLHATRVVLTVLAGGFLILAAARPQWGEKMQLYRGRGIDVVITLDASRSMTAEDVKPNRLARAKMELQSLIDRLSRNRVAITAFAGDCYVLCPLTDDVEAAKLFLDLIDENLAPVPGTNFARAVEVACSLFDPEESSHKALIFVTDGDNLGPSPLPAVERAARQGVRIFTIGYGSPQGAPIPIKNDAGELIAYKKDSTNQMVMSRLDEPLLIKMANLTGGRYFRGEELSPGDLLRAIEQIEKKEITGGSYVEYEERFQYPLFLSFLLLVCALFLPGRRRRWLRWPLFTLLAFAVARGGEISAHLRRGNSFYQEGKYEEALQAYEEAEMLEPDAPEVHYNKACALYRQGKHEEAVQELEIATTAKDKSLQQKAWYNMGNACYRSGQLDRAIESYVRALLLDPRDLQAKQNLEFCLKMMQEGAGGQKNEQGGQQKEEDRRNQKTDEKRGSGASSSQDTTQAKQKEGPVNREQAARILQAMQAAEKRAQRKARSRGEKIRVAKDW